MNINYIFLKWILIVSITSSVTLHAASNAASFMEIGYQPEAQALGMTGVAYQTGSSSVYWNPARLSTSTENDITGMLYSAFETDFMAIQGLFHWKTTPIGFYINQARVDGFLTSQISEETQRVVLTGERFDYEGRGIIVGTGKQLSDKISLGASIKYISEKASTANAYGIGADMSIYASPYDTLSIGILVQNIIKPTMQWNTPSQLKETVPTKLRIGTTSLWFSDLIGVHQEAVIEQGKDIYVNWGMHYALHRYLRIEGGINQSNLSLGLALTLNPLSLYFSWTSPGRSIIDDYYKFGLQFNL